jgi:hypothetical protein
MKTIYDSVNFDYPNCGGVEIKKARKYYHIYNHSNYTGNNTGKHIMVSVEATKNWKGDLVENLIEEIGNPSAGTKIVSNGFLVQ